MNVNILNSDSKEITVQCNCAYLVNNNNSLSMTFDDDNFARYSEELLKKMNIKTRHNDKEITILNICEYNLSFN